MIGCQTTQNTNTLPATIDPTDHKLSKNMYFYRYYSSGQTSFI